MISNLRQTSDTYFRGVMLAVVIAAAATFLSEHYGATIHDVAQVVGAGYSVSEEAGVIATFVKMLRVALLPLVMLVVMLSFRRAQNQKLVIPWFLVMFIGLAILANTGLVPQDVLDAAGPLSRWCLVIAISALGVKTNLAKFAQAKPSYAVILVVETLFLLGLAVLFVSLGGI